MLISSGGLCLLPYYLSSITLQLRRVCERKRERALHGGYGVRCWVHSPDVCPCRECVCMCVCCVRSIVLSIWNMRRSSSSRAMSPQKTAASKKNNSQLSSLWADKTISTQSSLKLEFLTKLKFVLVKHLHTFPQSLTIQWWVALHIVA